MFTRNMLGTFFCDWQDLFVTWKYFKRVRGTISSQPYLRTNWEFNKNQNQKHFALAGLKYRKYTIHYASLKPDLTDSILNRDVKITNSQTYFQHFTFWM